MATDPRLYDLCLYAWVGEDEFHPKHVGIKQGQTTHGFIPLVGIDMNRQGAPTEALQKMLQAQANQYGKSISLVRFSFAGEILTLTPEKIFDWLVGPTAQIALCAILIVVCGGGVMSVTAVRRARATYKVAPMSQWNHVANAWMSAALGWLAAGAAWALLLNNLLRPYHG